jgi:hypothetical protein
VIDIQIDVPFILPCCLWSLYSQVLSCKCPHFLTKISGVLKRYIYGNQVCYHFLHHLTMMFQSLANVPAIKETVNVSSNSEQEKTVLA